jgi:DNA-binding NtrC family response regulator
LTNLFVFPLTDAFSALWPELAGELGVDLRLVTSVDEIDGSAAIAVLIGAGGAEEEAEPLIRALRAAGTLAPVVVGTASEHRVAIPLIRAGADDYLSLPAELELLRSMLRDLSSRAAGRQAGGRLAHEERATFDFGRIIGKSRQLREALDRASRIIPRDRATVLITGETGTGKELLARAIHYNGPRSAAPFVELNCAAIPAGLVESELFGHERGAFTDARSAKPGLFEAAEGGTLFLDEIGHLPFELQGKILRALEEKQVRRIGALRPRELDVRIIAATHVDLADAVRRGEFREDLYYRLSVIPIHLPPLRDRGEDVLLLAEHFLDHLADQYDLRTTGLTSDLKRALLAHSWPGNVRELRNALERSLLLGDGVPTIGDLFAPTVHVGAEGGSAIPFPARLSDIERSAARGMVERLEGNKSAAADAQHATASSGNPRTAGANARVCGVRCDLRSG